MQNIVSIHLPEKPTVNQCATALRLLVVVAGADVFGEACDMIPDIGVDTSKLDDAGFAPMTGAVTPPAPPPPATMTNAAPEFDSKGLAYDARIHSGTKGQNKDGSWKQRRGVDDATITAVEAELRAAHGTPAAPAAPPPPAAAPAAPPPPAAVTPPAPPPPAGAADPAQLLPLLMKKVTPLIASKKLTMQDINEMCVSLGAPTLLELNKLSNRADLFPILESMVDSKA